MINWLQHHPLHGAIACLFIALLIVYIKVITDDFNDDK